KDVPALMQLATINEQTRNYDAARENYEQLLAINKNFFPALNNLAVLYSEQFGKLDKAYELAKKAREISPTEPHTADTLGWIMFKRGDYHDALQLVQESATKMPDIAETQFHLGMVQYMLGQEEAARVALQKAADAAVDFTGKDEARK